MAKESMKAREVKRESLLLSMLKNAPNLKRLSAMLTLLKKSVGMLFLSYNNCHVIQLKFVSKIAAVLLVVHMVTYANSVLAVSSCAKQRCAVKSLA